MRRSARFGTIAVLLVCLVGNPGIAATDYPPGLSPDGVTDAEALSNAHEATLRDASYTYSARYIQRASNGTVLERVLTRAQVAADGRFNATHRETGLQSDGPNTGTYANESVVYTAIYQNETVVYARAPPSKRATARERFLGTFYIRWLLKNTNVTVERVERNTTVAYKVKTPAPQSASFGTNDVTNLSVRAVISRAGIVREFKATYERGGTHVVVYRSYSAIGSTNVDRPGWLAEAVENATREGRTLVDRPLLVLLGYAGFLTGLVMVTTGTFVGVRRLQWVGSVAFLLGVLALVLG